MGGSRPPPCTAFIANPTHTLLPLLLLCSPCDCSCTCCCSRCFPEVCSSSREAPDQIVILSSPLLPGIPPDPASLPDLVGGEALPAQPMAAPDPGPAAATVTVTVAPAPRSPPKYPDFCGRRRLQLEVQMLNREIGFLQEELQSLEGAQPVSRCCKDVNEFVGANPDPLIPITKKRHKSCGIWKWLRLKLCFCFSSACCSCRCSLHLKRPSCACPHPTCCACPYPTCCSCGDCQCRCPTCSCCKFSCCRPKCCCPEISCCPDITCCLEISCCKPRCCRWEDIFCCPLPFCGCRRCCRCCFDFSCCKPRCSFPSLSCPEYSCGCIWSCPRCTDFQLCPKCTKTCCVSGCEC